MSGRKCTEPTITDAGWARRGTMATPALDHPHPLDHQLGARTDTFWPEMHPAGDHRLVAGRSGRGRAAAGGWSGRGDRRGGRRGRSAGRAGQAEGPRAPPQCLGPTALATSLGAGHTRQHPPGAGERPGVASRGGAAREAAPPRPTVQGGKAMRARLRSTATARAGRPNGPVTQGPSGPVARVVVPAASTACPQPDGRTWTISGRRSSRGSSAGTRCWATRTSAVGPTTRSTR